MLMSMGAMPYGQPPIQRALPAVQKDNFGVVLIRCQLGQDAKAVINKWLKNQGNFEYSQSDVFPTYTNDGKYVKDFTFKVTSGGEDFAREKEQELTEYLHRSNFNVRYQEGDLKLQNIHEQQSGPEWPHGTMPCCLG